MKSSIKDFFSKCDQIYRKLQIWSHLLKKSLMGNFIFCVVIAPILFVQPPRISFFNSHCEKFVNLPLGKQSSFFQSIRYHWLCISLPKNWVTSHQIFDAIQSEPHTEKTNIFLKRCEEHRKNVDTGSMTKQNSLI